MLNWMTLMTGAPPGQGGAGGGSTMSLLLMIGLTFLIFFFLIIRPQQKRQKEQKTMLDSLQNGDRIVTSGGMIGNVVGTKEENGVQILVLKIADNTKVEVSRAHLQQIILKNT